MKNSNDVIGYEPTNFCPVAQCLNQWHYCMLHVYVCVCVCVCVCMCVYLSVWMLACTVSSPVYFTVMLQMATTMCKNNWRT